MRRSSFLMSAAALLFAATTAQAQAKPNFSGKWTIVPDTAATPQGISAGGGEMGGLGEYAVVEQNDKTLTVTRNTPNMGEMKSIFNLDGTETYSTVNVQGQSIPLTMKTRWDGTKLVTSTWANVGQPIEIILNFSLDDKGNLVTEHILPSMGGAMAGGTLTTHYKKGS